MSSELFEQRKEHRRQSEVLQARQLDKERHEQTLTAEHNRHKEQLAVADRAADAAQRSSEAAVTSAKSAKWSTIIAAVALFIAISAAFRPEIVQLFLRGTESHLEKEHETPR